MNRAILFVSMLALSDSAHAYVGPGVGAGVLAGIIGFLAAILLLLIGSIYYPIKRMLKKKKTKKIDE